MFFILFVLRGIIDGVLNYVILGYLRVLLKDWFFVGKVEYLFFVKVEGRNVK